MTIRLNGVRHFSLYKYFSFVYDSHLLLGLSKLVTTYSFEIKDALVMSYLVSSICEKCWVYFCPAFNPDVI